MLLIIITHRTCLGVGVRSGIVKKDFIDSIAVSIYIYIYNVNESIYSIGIHHLMFILSKTNCLFLLSVKVLTMYVNEYYYKGTI